MEGFDEVVQEAQRLWNQIKSDPSNGDEAKLISSKPATGDELCETVLAWYITKERLLQQKAREREGWALACVLGLWIIITRSIWLWTTCLTLTAVWCFPFWAFNQKVKGRTILPLPTYIHGEFAYWLLALHISMSYVYVIAAVSGMVK